jgi:hypothetical protein
MLRKDMTVYAKLSADKFGNVILCVSKSVHRKEKRSAFAAENQGRRKIRFRQAHGAFPVQRMLHL